MNRAFVFATFLIAALVPGGAHANLRITASIPDLAAIAKEIGGDAVTVTALSSYTQDPHFTDPKPSFIVAMNRSDLLLAAGLDLDVGWLPTLITQSRNPKVQPGAPGHLDCGQLVKPLDVPAARVDRAMGDIHPRGNPHYFHDPRAMVGVARGIAARMAALDAGNADRYRRGAEAFVARISARTKDWETRMAPWKGAPVITFHKSWSYLCAWLGLDVVGYVEPKPGVPPSPPHIAGLIVKGRQAHVKVILREPYYQDSLTRVLAEKIGSKILDLPASADTGRGETYGDRLEQVIAKLVAGLAAGTGTAAKGAKP